MKRHLLTCIALSCAMLGAMAQRSYTFNAVALNVDGLPNEDISILDLATVNLNKDGKNEAGATELCGILANSGWDIVGLSEDFNFHNYLAAEPASTYYNFGKHSGSISTNFFRAFNRAEIDGLGLAVAKRFTFTGDSDTGLQVKWDEEYGGSGIANVGDNGADNMITKGFRMYTVTLADGVAVDVYVLHMDASTADSDDDYDNGKDKNIVAREAQLAQLATYIKNNHNNRPVIILGDTNCRYTREALKTGFIDVINADSRFTIKDAWVELMWGGTYPTYGGESMMTHTYGAQKGEVVDKVFYINTTESDLTLKANSYFNDESISVSDHTPIVVNFTITDPNGTPLTDAEKEANWTLEESGSDETSTVITGSEVESGKTYFLKNVGSGTYLKSGCTWGTQASEGSAGIPITFQLISGNVYSLQTMLLQDGSTTDKGYMGSSDSPYMDRPIGESNWTLTPIYDTDASGYQYQLINDNGKALAYTSDASHAVTCVEKDDNSDNQKWVLLTEDDIRTQMSTATAEAPYDITPLLKAADFDHNNTENNTTNWGSGFSNCTVGGARGASATDYNYAAMINSTPNAVSISQTLKDLPAGTYKFSFEGFYNYLLTTTTKTEERTKGSGWFASWSSWSQTGTTTTTNEQTMTAQVTIGNETFNLSPNRNVNVGDAAQASIAFRDGDGYMTTSFQTLEQGPLNISISKPATSSNSSEGPTTTVSESKRQVRETYTYEYSNSVFFDNFELIYYGTGEVAVDPYKDYKDMVLTKVNETYPKVILLNAAGQAAYDISVVVDRYNNDQITNAAIAQDMCDFVDAAYANALAAHKAYYVEEALKNMEANGGDVTGAIINPSFETGDLTGWTVGSGWDVGVYPNSNGTYTASGCDGNYLFNAWSGDESHTTNIKQTVTGLTNGLYELKALLTSFGTINNKSHDYRIYLTGNSYHTSVAANEGNGVFKEATLYFLVEDGMATIGAVGGNKGGGSTFIHYWPDEGCFFKADNFRLKYICDVPHGRLKLALDEANAATLDVYGKDALDLSSYETAYTNKSLSGDGKTEVEAIYTALQAAAKAQRTAGADMTWAITNPSFETGDYTGWTVVDALDDRIDSQESNIKVAGTDGRYLFNTWNNADGTNNTNQTITQTVTGIPNGTYKLTAMLATDAGSNLSLTANGETTAIAASSNGNSSGVFPEVTCTVTDGTLAIEAGGVDGVWYKADDFHLTLVKPSELVFNETDKVISEINGETFDKVTLYRTIKPNTWSTFVSPFAIPRSALGNDWEVKKLTSTEVNDERITLVFSDANDIEAGVPYMVRNQKLGENLTTITMENVTVNTTALNNTNTDDITFIGVYTDGYVPQGSYFISSNVFYQAADESNRLKGFRAYLQPIGDATKARSLSYRFVTGDDDEGTTAIDNEQLTNDNEVTVVGIYTLGGVRINDMQEGVNILQMSNGTTMKVIIK